MSGLSILGERVSLLIEHPTCVLLVLSSSLLSLSDLIVGGRSNILIKTDYQNIYLPERDQEMKPNHSPLIYKVLINKNLKVHSKSL